MITYGDMCAVVAECTALCPIPEQANRKRAEHISSEVAKRLAWMTSAKSPKVGRSVAFWHRDNLGTKRFSDVRRILHISVIVKITPKCIWTADGCRITQGDIVCVGTAKGVEV